MKLSEIAYPGISLDTVLHNIDIALCKVGVWKDYYSNWQNYELALMELQKLLKELKERREHDNTRLSDTHRE